MKMTRRQLFCTAAGAAACNAVPVDWNIQPGPFTGDRESLKKYRCPDWFRDAKFGIWAVWGPEAVPEAGDWYARNMYIEGSAQYKYHLEHYGHPSKFGYKDIVALWKGENFDPARLMRLYKKTGAKYFVTIANHHDNFDLWNSKYTRWNAVKMGPKKDVVGLFRKAALNQGLRFGVSEHLWISYKWLAVSHGSDKSGPLAGKPYDGVETQYADLYHDAGCARFASPKLAWNADGTPDSWKLHWFRRIKDLLDQHRPDLLYTDGALPFEEYGLNLVAHHYNQDARRHGGVTQAIYNSKRREDCQTGTCVLDVERGVVNDIWPNPWQTDTCIGDWYYKRGIKYKTVASVVHQLADIVSKNGNLLLNIPPKPDGSLDAESEAFLEGFGGWMAINGEAIYGTRPWRKYGEGPTQAPSVGFNETKIRYTVEDVRFTTKPGVLYAITLGLPSGAISIRSLAGAQPKSVHLLGLPEPLKFRREDQGLTVELPDRKPSEHALVLKIAGIG